MKCDLCGATMIERHCRLICSECGFVRDCSDPMEQAFPNHVTRTGG